jgi:dipeptidyl aminopeptidase/acylaminoacyl peptidase
MECTRRSSLIWALLFGALIDCLACWSQAAPPLEAYGRLPGVELMRLSPSGERIAMVVLIDEKRQLHILTADNKLLKSALLGDAKVRDLNWAGDDHLLITVTATVNLRLQLGQSYELASVTHVGLDGKEPWQVFAGALGIQHTVFGYYGSAHQGAHWSGYFGGISAVRNAAGGVLFDHTYPDLYRVDLGSGKPEVEAKGSEREHTWVVAADGGVFAHSEYDQKSGEWQVFVGSSRSAALRKVSLTNDIELAGLGRNPGTLLVLDRSGDADVVQEINVADGKTQELLSDHSVTDYHFDPLSNLLTGARVLEEPGELFFDPEPQERFNSARSAFPGLRVQLESYSRNLKRMIVQTTGAADSGTFWLVDIDAAKAAPLGYAYPEIKGADVGATSMVRFHAADGLAMDGVLTLPPGREAKGLPLVVLPHGGPIDIRDELGFDWWAQAFASRGYAVFQPNYRGSGGVSPEFRRAGYGQWGRKMLSDIADGAAELARQQVVDPKRVCIVGASYGGYAALAGVTLQQGLYRCAVSVAGPADLQRFSFWRNDRYGFNSGDVRYWRKITGVDTAGDSLLREISPALRADKADAPILLIHGKEDTRVPMEQSELMAAALKNARKTYEFLVLPHEDHFLSRDATRIAMLQAALKFVEKYDPPQ